MTRTIGEQFEEWIMPTHHTATQILGPTYFTRVRYLVTGYREIGTVLAVIFEPIEQERWEAEYINHRWYPRIGGQLTYRDAPQEIVEWCNQPENQHIAPYSVWLEGIE